MEEKANRIKALAPNGVRATRTRPALYDALLSLLAEKSFEQVTIREITGRAGIGYATFFRHYPDKESLLNDLATLQIKQLMGLAVPLLYSVDSRASTQALCAYVWEHRELWTILLTGGAAGTLRDELLKQSQQLSAHVPSENTRIPAYLRNSIPVIGVIEIITWWLKQSDPPPASRVADLLDILVIKPILEATRDVGHGL